MGTQHLPNQQYPVIGIPVKFSHVKGAKTEQNSQSRPLKFEYKQTCAGASTVRNPNTQNQSHCAPAIILHHKAAHSCHGLMSTQNNSRIRSTPRADDAAPETETRKNGRRHLRSSGPWGWRTRRTARRGGGGHDRRRPPTPSTWTATRPPSRGAYRARR